MFAKDGYSTILGVLTFSALLIFGASYIQHWSKYILIGIGIVLSCIVIYFFRDPDRNLPDNPNVIVAPADGKVILMEEIDEPLFIGGKGTQISIFLSLFDVHVNRLPVGGTVDYVKYHPGQYLVAWHEKASELNERADFGVTHPSGTKVFFRQITGLVARRIVYRIEEGDTVETGKRFGIMKFGSRMDIVVPPEVEISIEKGARTVGGETVLGVIPDED